MATKAATRVTVLSLVEGWEDAASRLEPKPGNLPRAFSTGLSGRERKVFNLSPISRRGERSVRCVVRDSRANEEHSFLQASRLER
jgi:hypothetical protein